MNLYEVAFNKEFVFMQKKMKPDGMGGFIIDYDDGETFKAALTSDTSTTGKIAEQLGVTSIYKLTAPKNVPLWLSDVLKDKQTGAFYRLTTAAGETETPEIASFQFQQFSAERFNL